MTHSKLKIKNLKLLITGGAGYIGTHTCVELLNAGFDITVYDNFCNSATEAIKRVGSSASDVGVSFDQLIALVTSAQQVTARGGSVIGNSFKTIFNKTLF
jgi:UDP-glucose 4-epimerase